MPGHLKGETLARPTDVARLTRGVVDRIQWRSEVIRPVVLLRYTTPQQRARETHTHPCTVHRLVRQFQACGMRGLLPRGVKVGGTRGTPHVSAAIRPDLHRLKALDMGTRASFSRPAGPSAKAISSGNHHFAKRLPR